MSTNPRYLTKMPSLKLMPRREAYDGFVRDLKDASRSYAEAKRRIWHWDDKEGRPMLERAQSRMPTAERAAQARSEAPLRFMLMRRRAQLKGLVTEMERYRDDLSKVEGIAITDIFPARDK